MDFGGLLTRSWNIVWNHKFLLVLGFLAALGSGTGNNASSNFDFSGSGSSDFDLPPGVAEDFSSFFSYFGPLLLVLLCVLVLLGIALWLVRLTAQAGMISAVSRIDGGEKVTLRSALADGWSRLGQMAGLNLLMYGPFTLVWLVAGAAVVGIVGTAVYQEATGGGGAEGIFAALGIFAICLIGLGCLTLPILLVVTFVYPFAQRGLVLQELGVVESVRHGWQTLRDNVAEILLLAFLFGFLGLIFGFVMIAVMIPVVVVAALPVLVPVINTGSIGAFEVGYIVVAGIVLVVIAATINSALITYRSTAFTLAYEEFLVKGNEE